MKKWTALLLSVLMIASVGLVGCGKEENLVNSSEEIASGVESTETSSDEGSSEESAESVSEESSSEESSSEETSSEESAVSSETSSKEETSKPASSKEESSKPASSKEEISSKPASSKEEASSKPASSSSTAEESSSEETSSEETSSAVESAASCMDLLGTAIDGANLPGMMFYEPSMDDAMEAELTEYFYTGFNLADVSDYCVGVPMMMVHASEVAIFKPVDDAAAKSVKSVIEARIEALTNVWSTYLPEQYALVEAHQVVEVDGYILFVVAADADMIVKQFKAAL